MSNPLCIETTAGRVVEVGQQTLSRLTQQFEADRRKVIEGLALPERTEGMLWWKKTFPAETYVDAEKRFQEQKAVPLTYMDDDVWRAAVKIARLRGRSERARLIVEDAAKFPADTPVFLPVEEAKWFFDQTSEVTSTDDAD